MTYIFAKKPIDEYLIGWTRHHHLPHATYNLVGPLLHVHFSHPFKGTTNDFYFIHESSPDQVAQAIEGAQHNTSYWLTVFCKEAHVREIMHSYEHLGYRFTIQETLMTKPLATGLEGMHHAMVGHSIEVTRTRESDSWAQAIASGIAISLTSLLDVVLWHYILKHDDHQVARGAWMLTPEHVAYIDDVETEEPYRRRGFAQTLMQRMLSDAAAAGATESILSASPMGRPLYQKLGYAEQAVILVLTKYEQGST